MRISLPAGTYVVAVSGGVDSMVLLDLLAQELERQTPRSASASSCLLKLIVAHCDHGMRAGSHHDRKLVQAVASHHKLPFVYCQAALGKTASEATARTARYAFLHHVKQASGARAIITAHHRDDVLETAIINIIRGTGRRGLTALKSTDTLVRPLLSYDKQVIYEYASNHGLTWREDPTNTDTRYLRNQVRHTIVPKMTAGQKAQLHILLDGLKTVNDTLDAHIINLLHSQPAKHILDRNWFIMLPHFVAREVAHNWLRLHGITAVTKQNIERLVTAMKTAKTGKLIDVEQGYHIAVIKGQLALLQSDR